MKQWFVDLGVEYIDHVAVTTRDLSATMTDWLAIPGARLLRGPADNPTQKVRYAFVRVNDGLVIEILAPLDEESPVISHLSQGGGAYHFCLAVPNIIHAIDIAMQAGAQLVVEPVADVAFDGREIAFLMHPEHGLFELVQTRPNRGGEQKVSLNSTIASDDLQQTPTVDETAGAKKLLGVVHRTFPDTKKLEPDEMKYGCVKKWDSLGQMRLVMEVEREFDIRLPIKQIAVLNNFKALLEFLVQ